MPQLPLLIQALHSLPITIRNRVVWYQYFILFFTFVCYTTYHLSRKPISVVKSVLHQNCTEVAAKKHYVITDKNNTFCSWAPFDKGDYTELLGSLEYAYLFAYAIGMLVSGHIAERVNLRHYLGIGMLLSGLTTAMFGFGYYLQIHRIEYYIFVQIFGGLVQATGWPSVVACVGHWFGKGRRGFIMGVWNSHTSAGNILGSVIAGLFVSSSWGLSFIVPGAIIFAVGCFCLLLLIPYPTDVGLPSPHDNDLDIMVQSVTPSTLDITEYAPNTHDRQWFDSPDSEQQQTSSLSASPVGATPPSRASSSVNQRVPAADTDPLLPRHSTLTESTASSDMGSRKAISLLGALRIPGVIEYSLCLFFAKLVSYTFLYWLPNYIKHSSGLNPEESAFLSTLFDVGGIVGGVLAGVVSDVTGRRALTCMMMLLLAAPMLFIYEKFGDTSLFNSIVLLLITGGLVNGPYALITTAVSADLGTSVKGDSKALATVTAIIDGTGSMGAALGPLLTGLIVNTGWQNVFYMLMTADLLALLLLCRMGLSEVNECRNQRTEPAYEDLARETTRS
ncbi:hypothetical protein BOX15_Mlig013591g3 [Macrostomum lignano]|uniref:Sugar phosphate exchanger 3 n=1 Tax=Macrostomum lignano TaxID=282301 RepID=A0A267FMY7_9PLAT|nr:hypothetical protein BOX15_Mlig013591g3 [Macrostomum lignano]